MADVVVRIAGKAKQYSDELKRVKKETEDLEKGLAQAAKISGVAFVGLTAAIGGTVAQAAKIETISTSFEVLTGSAETARDTVKELQEFSARTPFQFDSIARAGQQLLGFGFQAEDLTKKLGQIGDVSAAVNADMNEVALIFGQVAAAGKLTGERLLQFQERAIPIGPALAETMGVAEESIKDLVSKGKVDFETFEKAFASLSEEGGIAFGGMARQSETLAGLISTLKDNFALVAAEIGQHFVPVLKQATEGLIGVLQFVREHPEITKMAAAFLAVTAAIAGATLVATTGGLAFLKLRAALIAAGGATKVLALGVKGLVGATGIGLLLIIATELYLNWERIWPAMQKTFEVFVKNVSNLGVGIGQILSGIFTANFASIKDGFNRLKTTALEAFTEIKDGISEGNKELVSQNENKNREIAAQNQTHAETEKERRVREFEEQLLEREEFQALTAEQRQQFLEENRQQITEAAMTDEEAKFAIAQEGLKKQQATNKQYLQDQQKFGKAFADINATIQSDRLQQAKSTSGQFIALQQSENATLKGIGKAAALTQIGIKTAEGAVSAYAALAPIPFVGPFLGIAAALALIAFGGEQAGKVIAAQKGGVMTGGIPGVDSIPTLTAPGEIIAPAQNFDETVNAVADARNRRSDSETEQTGGTSAVVIGFDGPEASQVLTARQVEDRALGINREAS